MARVNGADVDKYGGGGGAGYFSLRNDGDVAAVRFLYDSADDIEGYVVHEAEVEGKKRYVNCLREYNQPMDTCPFCAARNYQNVKLFIPVYNIDDDKVQVWERGKKFYSKISGICNRYNKAPIVSQIFEIERHGKPGDTQTTYEIYSTNEVDNTTLDDFEVPEVLGTIVLDKTPEEMEFYLDNGSFPVQNSDVPVRRSSNRNTQAEPEPRQATHTRRRVPAKDDTF